MYTDYYRLQGSEHSLTVCLPTTLPPTAGPGRYVGLTLGPRARAGLLRARPGGAHAASPAPGPGLPGRRAAPPPGAPAHPPAERPAAPPGRRAHQHPDRPASGHLRGQRCAPTWRTSTHDWASPAAPPPSPAPSPTGPLRAHGHGEGGVSWSPPSSSQPRYPRERAPGLGSAKPIACDATAGSDLDAVAGSGTLEREEDDYRQHRHGAACHEPPTSSYQFKDNPRSEASTLLRSPVTVSLMVSLCGGVAVTSAVNDHLLRRDPAAGRSWRDRDSHGVPEGEVNRLADRVGGRADRDDRALAGDVGGPLSDVLPMPELPA